MRYLSEINLTTCLKNSSLVLNLCFPKELIIRARFVSPLLVAINSNTSDDSKISLDIAPSSKECKYLGVLVSRAKSSLESSAMMSLSFSLFNFERS